MEMKKLLAVGIIFLFISVAVAQSINFTVVKASNDNDLVEVTSQACGIQGFGNTTVKLTKQQYQNLEQYLVDFRARLNKTTTREEAVPIFKEAVVELNKYGLLPKRMSVEQAQKLVTNGYLNEKIMERAESIFHKIKTDFLPDTNFFCLVGGELNLSVFVSGIFMKFVYASLIMGDWFWSFIDKFFPSPIFSFLFLLSLIGLIALYILSELHIEIANHFPLSIGHIIGVGWYSHDGADGWMDTFGLLGVKKWDGSLLGTLPTMKILYDPGYFDPGVLYFTGLKISLNKDTFNHFFIGSAFWVNITKIG